VCDTSDTCQVVVDTYSIHQTTTRIVCVTRLTHAFQYESRTIYKLLFDEYYMSLYVIQQLHAQTCLAKQQMMHALNVYIHMYMSTFTCTCLHSGDRAARAISGRMGPRHEMYSHENTYTISLCLSLFCLSVAHTHTHAYMCVQGRGVRGLYPAEWDHDISFWVPDGFEDAAFETLARCECACVYVSVSVCECVCVCACISECEFV